jgi:hypothetical protein
MYTRLDPVHWGINFQRGFFVTKRGYLTLAPRYTKPGDLVCLIFGAEVPFVLRPDGLRYRLVGECYVHGMMDGEGLGLGEEDKWFDIF